VDEAESGIPAVRSRLSAAGIEIQKIEKILPSLEDVFVSLIEAEEKKSA